jgi:nucleotide-binding universal stress UspA family protein
MIKDIMVYVDGSAADEMRLVAVDDVARLFQSQVIALYLNAIPSLAPVNAGAGGLASPLDLVQQAKEEGDMMEAVLAMRLARLERPVEIRRFDILADEVANIGAREARTADTFVALRPNGELQEPERLVESVLFGSGRHLLLVPEGERPRSDFNRVLVAWNGGRESARALAEAMPFLHQADEVSVIFVGDENSVADQYVPGASVVQHLKHHGIDAVLEHVKSSKGEVAATLMAECEKQKADLLVMGGYGHSRLREWLLGGVTYELLHGAPIPILVAH